VDQAQIGPVEPEARPGRLLGAVTSVTVSVAVATAGLGL